MLEIASTFNLDNNKFKCRLKPGDAEFVPSQTEL
jgi:hypothetical protein